MISILFNPSHPVIAPAAKPVQASLLFGQQFSTSSPNAQSPKRPPSSADYQAILSKLPKPIRWVINAVGAAIGLTLLTGLLMHVLVPFLKLSPADRKKATIHFMNDLSKLIGKKVARRIALRNM